MTTESTNRNILFWKLLWPLSRETEDLLHTPYFLCNDQASTSGLPYRVDPWKTISSSIGINEVPFTALAPPTGFTAPSTFQPFNHVSPCGPHNAAFEALLAIR